MILKHFWIFISQPFVWTLGSIMVNVELIYSFCLNCVQGNETSTVEQNCGQKSYKLDQG